MRSAWDIPIDLPAPRPYGEWEEDYADMPGEGIKELFLPVSVIMALNFEDGK